MGKFQDLTNRQFGRLRVIECAGKNKHNQYQWLCECSCENHTRIIVNGGNLKQGHTKSCGCLIENCYKSNLKHGLSRTRINATYRHMKDRCFNPKSQYYDDYGGRGIIVCDEWMGKDGFINFYNWAISHGYDEKLTLDRIDNNKGYCPDNCRWATCTQQNCNKRNNHYITLDNQKKTVKEWCDIYGISTHTFYYRVRKLHLDEITAITSPHLHSGGKKRRV